MGRLLNLARQSQWDRASGHKDRAWGAWPGAQQLPPSLILTSNSRLWQKLKGGVCTQRTWMELEKLPHLLGPSLCLSALSPGPLDHWVSAHALEGSGVAGREVL